MDDKGCLSLMAVFDADIVVAPMDIEFGEKLGVFELIDEVRDEGKGVRILNSVFF